MFTSELIKQHSQLSSAAVQVVKVEPRLDREGKPSLKNGLPKYKVSAVVKSDSGEMSVAEFTAAEQAGEALSVAKPMSSWKVLDVDGWIYADRSGNVKVSFAVSHVEEIQRNKAVEGKGNEG